MSDASIQNSPTGPRLSIVFPAERPETVRRMREALRAQTVRDQIEVVVVRYPGSWADGPHLHEDGYGALRIVDVAPGMLLAEARAAGARAATTPLVFFAETHAYPRPDWAAAVLAAAERGRGEVIASSFVNANPENAVSWAAFILDYGAYGDDQPGHEIPSAPMHKGTFLRADLLALGERLAPALSSGDELPLSLEARGRRGWFEPAARIDHLNVPALGLWLRGRYLIGFLIGCNRAQRWSLPRRALYVLLAPAIPLVLLWRIRPVARRFASSHMLPSGLWSSMLLGAIARAAGEAIGYACGEQRAMQRRADEYELFESVYAGGAR